MNKKIITALSGIVVIGAVVTWFAYKNNQAFEAQIPASNDTAATPTPVATKPEVVVPTSTGIYKDGTYSATGTYFIPEGSEQISVTVTLKNGVVTDAQFVASARRGDSREFQVAFADGYKQFVVGKPIDKVSLTVVNGSSLTPKGFMDALTKIKAQARA